jgi:hypothetical protein
MRGFRSWSIPGVQQAFAMVLAAIVFIVKQSGGLRTLFDLQQYFRGLNAHTGMLCFDDHKRGKLRKGDVVVLPSGSTITWVPPGKVHKRYEPFVAHFHPSMTSSAFVFAQYAERIGLAAQPDDAFLFPLIDACSEVCWEYPADDAAFLSWWVDRARAIGVPEDIVARMTGHIFRSGGCTDLVVAGAPAAWIKIQGRWRSDAFLVYFRASRFSLSTVAADMFDHIHRAAAKALPVQQEQFWDSVPDHGHAGEQQWRRRFFSG